MLTGQRTLSARKSGLLATRSSGAACRRTAAHSSGVCAKIAADAAGTPAAFSAAMRKPPGTPIAQQAIAAVASRGAVASHCDRPAAAKMVSTSTAGSTPRQARSLLAIVLANSQGTTRLAPASRANPTTSRFSAAAAALWASAPPIAAAPAR